MKFIEKIHIEEEERVEVSISKEVFCLMLAFCRLSLYKDEDDFEERINVAIEGLIDHGMEMTHQSAGFTKDWRTNRDWFKSQKQDKIYELYEELKKASNEKLEVTNENT